MPEKSALSRPRPLNLGMLPPACRGQARRAQLPAAAGSAVAPKATTLATSQCRGPQPGGAAPMLWVWMQGCGGGLWVWMCRDAVMVEDVGLW